MDFAEIAEFLRAGSEDIYKRKRALHDEAGNKLKSLTLDVLAEDFVSQFDSNAAFYHGTYHYPGDPITFRHRSYYEIVVTKENMTIIHDGLPIHKVKDDKVAELYEKLSVKLEKERNDMPF